MGEGSDVIIFLGTGGARVMVAHQLLASGGAWLELGNTNILLDPGPGCIVQATKRKLDPTRLDAIVLSHRHLDHSSDVNIMIEAMTDAARRRRGALFVPADALEEDPVVLRYLRHLPERIETLGEGTRHTVGEVSFETPVRHVHGVETYGFVFTTPRRVFSWITDTRYFEGLADHYHGELLVVHVVSLESGHGYDHLSLADAARIIAAIRPRAAILTHFGRTMWAARPWELAARVSAETGVHVIAARDGMRFDLARLGSMPPS
ncbi:MAG: MBL fold metallo-hydrolase [Chloroflexi bacterium]|nr:MBL fold metallo-hydrolase [Chloroflexota bacterium]